MDYPAAIELAIWLNQYRVGAISATDAANAAETITEVTSVAKDAGSSNPVSISWPDLIAGIAQDQTPIFAVLPAPGRTYGLAKDVLTRIDQNSGVCVINQTELIGQLSEAKGQWELIKSPSPLNPPDSKFARANLQDLLNDATAQLTAFELAGDRSNVDDELYQLRPIHLPPALPSRAKADLELAQRIWLIAQFGISDARAHASPSSDQKKISMLNQLKFAALELMAASTAVAK